MLASKKKISTRQACVLFLTLVYSPAIRLFPVFAADIAERAGWLGPIFAVVPFIGLVFVMQSLFKNEKEANLSDLIIKIMGKIPGRAILFLYLLWLMVLLGLYVRYYAERFLTSLLPHTPMAFFTITILAVTFYAVRGGLVQLARTTEFFFLLFTAVFVFLFILCLTSVEMINLLPVTHYDFWPLTKSTYAILGIWAYFPFMFFFGDEINDKEHIKRFGLQSTAYLVIIGLMLLIQTIGTYGYSIIARVSLPYIIVIKSISVLETIERIESMALAFWVITDFVIISVFTYMIVSIIKSLFSLSEKKSLVSPVTLFAFIFSLYLARNRLELAEFSKYIGLPLNIFFGFAIPFILFVIGKIRKKI